MSETQQILRDFIGRELLFGEIARLPTGDKPLIGTGGVVDSIGLNQLIGFVESRFGFQVDDLDIVPENFGTMNALESYIQRMRPGT